MCVGKLLDLYKDELDFFESFVCRMGLAFHDCIEQLNEFVDTPTTEAVGFLLHSVGTRY